MNDTRPEARKIQNELFAKFTGEERVIIASEMFETARKIVLSSLPENLSDKEIKQAVFLRFYRKDFTEQQIAEIFKRYDLQS